MVVKNIIAKDMAFTKSIFEQFCRSYCKKTIFVVFHFLKFLPIYVSLYVVTLFAFPFMYQWQQGSEDPVTGNVGEQSTPPFVDQQAPRIRNSSCFLCKYKYIPGANTSISQQQIQIQKRDIFFQFNTTLSSKRQTEANKYYENTSLIFDAGSSC